MKEDIATVDLFRIFFIVVGGAAFHQDNHIRWTSNRCNKKQRFLPSAFSFTSFMYSSQFLRVRRGMSAETIADIADAIEAAKRLADQQGV